MQDLTTQVRIGDITFGAPPGIPLLHTPWGYYKFLDVPTTASHDEINRAWKAKAKEIRPDLCGNEQEGQALNHVAEVLLDDGGQLGKEHGRRAHYDAVCTLDSFFDGFIAYEGERTRKFSEVMLSRMEIDRKNSEVIQRVSEKFPEIKELKSKLHKSSGKKAEKIIRDMNKLAARAAEIPEDMIQKMHEKIEEEKDRIRKEKNEFLGRLNSSPATYFSKILDILYLGQGKVTFSPDYVGGIGIFDFNEGDNILRLVIGGDCTFSGFKKVHLKAETADLDLQDPRVEGVFHIMKGNVRVRYESSTYGGIIRVKTQSPDSVRTEGFARKGDLFVPEAFAKGRVWNNKPAVEIAVKEGYVSLVLTSPSYHTSYDFAYYDSIRNKKKSIEKSDLESIISYEKYNKSKYYR